MQYGFMAGRESIDAVFVLTRLTEKFRAKNKKLFFIFIDLEKTFDRVSREVIRFALWQEGVTEYLVVGVMSLYIKVEKLLSQLTRNYQVHFL